jgi:hypothetical protein
MTMPDALAIPEAFRPGFQELAQLDDASFATLFAALTASPPALLPANLARRLVSQVNLNQKVVETIIVSAMSTFSLADRLSRPAASLTGSIAASSDLQLGEDAARVLTSRLDQLIAAETLVVTAKALQVLTAHEHPLHSSRILTDLRPVFLPDPAIQPTTAGIIHTLALTIHRGDGGLERLSVAMDEEDLRQLKEAVTRAETKSRTLAAFCHKAGMKVIELREAL